MTGVRIGMLRLRLPPAFQHSDRRSGLDMTNPPHAPYVRDYAMWGPGVDHIWQAHEDTVIITVRWPSVAAT